MELDHRCYTSKSRTLSTLMAHFTSSLTTAQVTPVSCDPETGARRNTQHLGSLSGVCFSLDVISMKEITSMLPVCMWACNKIVIFTLTPDQWPLNWSHWIFSVFLCKTSLIWDLVPFSQIMGAEKERKWQNNSVDLYWNLKGGALHAYVCMCACVFEKAIWLTLLDHRKWFLTFKSRIYTQKNI